jgi:hypothetical protein
MQLITEIERELQILVGERVRRGGDGRCGDCVNGARERAEQELRDLATRFWECKHDCDVPSGRQPGTPG